MQFERYETIEAMMERVRASPTEFFVVEPGIYSDNVGLTWRPQLALYREGGETIVLRFFYYAGSDVDHYRRTEARRHAEALAQG